MDGERVTEGEKIWNAKEFGTAKCAILRRVENRERKPLQAKNN